MAAAAGVRLWGLFAEREKIGLDSSPFIYYLNRQQPYFPQCLELLRWLETGRLRGVLSVVSEMELLAAPEVQNRRQLVNDVEALLGRLRYLEIVNVDRTIARRAAELRALHRLKGLDALIGATAASGGCRYLIGNDAEFAKRLTEIEYLVLDDLIARKP